VAFQQEVKISDFNDFLADVAPQVPMAEVEKTTSCNSTKIDSAGNILNSYDFPEGGWECSTCSNYNFKGRKCCYRCKKDFSQNDIIGKPKHMLMHDEEKAA